MNKELTFGDFILFIGFFVLLLFLIILLVFSIINIVDFSISDYRYNQELERFCELKYDSFNCKVHDRSFDEVVFYDKTRNEFIYDKLENILQK